MNLSDLPKAEQDAIEADKQAWFKAWTMIREWDDQSIRKWLAAQEPDYRRDMARRLNHYKQAADKEKADGRLRVKQKHPPG
jgi:hypothetical protein